MLDVRVPVSLTGLLLDCRLWDLANLAAGA
jgi:hypothetical protein